MAVVVFVVGMGWIANDDPYIGGIYAPLMALCAALLLLLNSLDSDASRRQKAVRGALAAIFGGVSAYFWIADAIGKRPTDPEVWFGFSLAWFLVFAYAVSTTLLIAATLANKDE